MDEIVKCDSCGVDTPATGSCRVEGFTDVDGYTYGGSYIIAVGICDRCYNDWDNSGTLESDRLAWIDKRVNDARSCCNGQFLARAILPIVEEFADLLRVHFAGEK